MADDRSQRAAKFALRVMLAYGTALAMPVYLLLLGTTEAVPLVGAWFMAGLLLDSVAGVSRRAGAREARATGDRSEGMPLKQARAARDALDMWLADCQQADWSGWDEEAGDDVCRCQFAARDQNAPLWRTYLCASCRRRNAAGEASEAPRG